MGHQVHIIYIPGLGDRYDGIRKTALKRWRSKRMKVTFVPMKWRHSTETLADKQQRIHDAIAGISASQIVLVGESAGGSMVITETFRRGTRVTKGITIFGKNIRADRVATSIYANNPAFRDSMEAADRTVSNLSLSEAKRITVLYSPFDPTIQYPDTAIPGAVIKKIYTPGHLFSIVLVLFVLKAKVINEAMKP